MPEYEYIDVIVPKGSSPLDVLQPYLDEGWEAMGIGLAQPDGSTLYRLRRRVKSKADENHSESN
jgi:hypothetical protein